MWFDQFEWFKTNVYGQTWIGVIRNNDSYYE